MKNEIKAPKFSVGQRVITEIGDEATVTAYRTGCDWDTVTLDNGRDYSPEQLVVAPGIKAESSPAHLCPEHGGTIEGNARMFASAPALLAALEGLVSEWQRNDPTAWLSALARARAAIALAGEYTQSRD